jgi:hypothetical protein
MMRVLRPQYLNLFCVVDWWWLIYVCLGGVGNIAKNT